MLPKNYILPKKNHDILHEATLHITTDLNYMLPHVLSKYHTGHATKEPHIKYYRKYIYNMQSKDIDLVTVFIG